MKIAVISDLHCSDTVITPANPPRHGHVGIQILEKAIARINSEDRPDILLVGGDLTNLPADVHHLDACAGVLKNSAFPAGIIFLEIFQFARKTSPIHRFNSRKNFFQELLVLLIQKTFHCGVVICPFKILLQQTGFPKIFCSRTNWLQLKFQRLRKFVHSRKITHFFVYKYPPVLNDAIIYPGQVDFLCPF